MTEAEAREIHRLGDRHGIEAWIAAEAWDAIPKGWRVVSMRESWRFELAPVPDAVVVSAFPPGPKPQQVVWMVEADDHPDLRS
jgi:hypothetical protein